MKNAMNDELPDGWQLIKLQDVASWGSGGTPPRKNPKYYGGDIPWIKTGELGDGLIFDTEEKITAAGLKNSSAKMFPKGSVAIAMYGATIGKVSILGIDAATNQACAVGIPDIRVTGPQYIFQYLRSQKDAFIAAGKGGAQPNLSQGVTKEWPFPLAPLAEQKRIADKLELLLGRVDACRARLDRVPALLKRFRQSVLAAATSGKLTEEWRLTNGVNDEWEEMKVSDVGSVQLGRQRAPKYHHGENMRPYLRVQNVFEARLDLSDVMEMEFSEADFTRYKLSYGDILLNEGQSPQYLGRSATFRDDLPGACFTNSLIRFRAKLDILDREYALLVFRHYMRSGRFAKEGSITTNIAHLSAGKFANIEFSLPPLPEQQEIVRRVGALFAFADRIEARLATAQKTIERLTPATLAKAFRGELVPQDPNDEPASALLERLRNTSEVKPAKAKRSKRTDPSIC